MATAWTIAIDWDRNGDYSGPYDDVTSRVISAQWFLGMDKPYEDIADNSFVKLTLENADWRYSPENTSSPLSGKVVPQRPVRIQSNDGTTTRTHWVGWIESIQPEVNKNGKRIVEIVATGAMQFLKATETSLPLQQNKRTDEIIGELIKEVVFPPALTMAWVLDRVGNSELNLTTRLADTSMYSVLQTGVLTLGLAADNWVRQGGYTDVAYDSYDVYRAIGEITAAEKGRFFFDRDGKAVFYNRNQMLQAGSPVATFDDTMTDMAYAYAGLDYCKNEVIAICHPRKISPNTNDILWKLEGAVINVDANQSRTVYVKYDDENGKRVGAQDVYVDGITFSSGSASVTIKPNANGAELTFTAGGSGAVVNGCTVRGRKIVDFGEMEAKAINQSSIIDYGRRTLRLNLPSIDNLDQAQYIANFERDRRSNPRGIVQALTVVSHGKYGGTHHANQLALTIGDRIRVKETQTGHDSNYYIVGEAHELTNGATYWKTTWYLEPTVN